MCPNAFVTESLVKIVDIAGLIRGAAQGEGLGNAFLSHIAAVDGIYYVVRKLSQPQRFRTEKYQEFSMMLTSFTSRVT
jgi:ribosome-binding ATPase YchF (GTP1/OBG family)